MGHSLPYASKSTTIESERKGDTQLRRGWELVGHSEVHLAAPSPS